MKKKGRKRERDRERECLVPRLITDNNEHGTVPGFNAIFDQGDDSSIYLLLHFALLVDTLFLVFSSIVGSGF